MKNYTLLVGNYGASNIGDDMLLEASKQILNGENLKIMSPVGGDFPIFNSGFRSFLLKPWNNFLALDAIWKSNRVVFGGGGLLNSDNWRSLVIWGQILFWASMIFGNGYGLRETWEETRNESSRALRTHILPSRTFAHQINLGFAVGSPP